jgi:phosphatidylserine synthase
MPIPVGAVCVAVIVHLLKGRLVDWPHAVVWLIYLFTLAGLMASRVRFPHFRRVLTNPRHPQILMLVMALLLAAVYYYSEIVLFGMLIAYLGMVAVSNLRRPAPARSLNGPPGEGV